LSFPWTIGLKWFNTFTEIAFKSLILMARRTGLKLIETRVSCLLPFGRKTLREKNMGALAGDEVIASWYEAAVKPESLLGQRVVDALCIGLLVVDVQGHTLFANEAAKRCLRCARGIVVRNCRVAMTETSAHARLYGLLATVAGGGGRKSISSIRRRRSHPDIGVPPAYGSTSGRPALIRAGVVDHLRPLWR
jgi:hypothetical protein